MPRGTNGAASIAATAQLGKFTVMHIVWHAKALCIYTRHYSRGTVVRVNKQAHRNENLHQGGQAEKEMLTFHDVIARIREHASSKRHMGTTFEKLCKFYLEKNSGLNLKNVWLWNDWPEKDASDEGIDIVAENNEGELYAIQCKLYDEEHLISKSDVDSFFEKSTGAHKLQNGNIVEFKHLMIMHAGNKISARLNGVLRRHGCKIIGRTHLENSNIDWNAAYVGMHRLKTHYALRPHQKAALADVVNGFTKLSIIDKNGMAVPDKSGKSWNRGKLIMACGTGKTLTSLRIAENLVGGGGYVLYLVPSIALMRQTIQEWSNQHKLVQRSIAVCSDAKVSLNEDAPVAEIPIPVTTDPNKIEDFLTKSPNQSELNIVYCTYQSSTEIWNAQKSNNHKFNLILCDEAHRTAVTEGTTSKSTFAVVHDNSKIRSERRIYMTATDRIFSPEKIKRAMDEQVKVHSMDEPKTYGPIFHRLKFSEALDRQLLVDYRVLVLNVVEDYMTKPMQESIANRSGGEIPMDDSAKMLGCWKALRNPEFESKGNHALQRAIVFADKIRSSEMFAEQFTKHTDQRFPDPKFACKVRHVDGKQNALERGRHIGWLRDSDEEPNICRMLSNARCLQEGVDVPALDAVVFLHAKRSKTDIVQAVGRVMRKPSDVNTKKKTGYVIIPVVVPGKTEESMNKLKNYETVWEVLRAMRSHDDEMDRWFAQMEYKTTRKLPKKIRIGQLEPDGTVTNIESDGEYVPYTAICAKAIETVGSREYWSNWTNDLENIARKLRIIINAGVLNNRNSVQAFKEFRIAMHEILNDRITDNELVDMLVQHAIAGPMFNVLFMGSRAENDRIGSILANIIENMPENIKIELKKLRPFYKKLEEKVEGMQDDHAAMQGLIKDVFENLFKKVFRAEANRLGIVYTPIEVVDFILHSVNWVLKHEFKRKIGDVNVEIIDPFVGSGTFITRLLSNELKLIDDNVLNKKYSNEIHANEIVLMAYYVASMNIAATYAARTKKNKRLDTLLLTDTFQQTGRTEFPISYPDVAESLKRQKNAKIQVVIGNPPYSIKRKNFDQGNRRSVYPKLQERVDQTYKGKNTVHGSYALSNSYVQAFRWATDRLDGDYGVIGFVTSSSYLKSEGTKYMRKSLANEFSTIYIIDLRGDVKAKGKWKEEGGKIFGSGSTEPICITIMVKNSESDTQKCNIMYFRFEDYMDRESKLNKLKRLCSIRTIKQSQWSHIVPDQNHDWFEQKDLKYFQLVPLHEPDNGIFSVYSNGAVSARDPWVCNCSKKTVEFNMKKTINYCKTLKLDVLKSLSQKESGAGMDETMVHLSKPLISRLLKYQNARRKSSQTTLNYAPPIVDILKFKPDEIKKYAYRPFWKMYRYMDPTFSDSPRIMHELFARGNLAIAVSVKSDGGFSALITNLPLDLQFLFNTKCYPRYTYSNNKKVDNITDSTLSKFQKTYAHMKITKTDIFYYIYGILHSKNYRAKFENELKGFDARIPLVKDFEAFSQAGKKLADLHLNYETMKRFPLKVKPHNVKSKQWKFHKLKFVKTKTETGTIVDKCRIIVNDLVTVYGIPSEAHDYKINGSSPLEWFVDRCKITKDRPSQIINDPNVLFVCNDTKDPCPDKLLAMLERLVYISVETKKVVDALPEDIKHNSGEAISFIA